MENKTTMEKITKDQEYQTRDGREVKVYDIHPNQEWPVHGAVQETNGQWYLKAWRIDGRRNDYETPDDLIPKPKTIKVWLHVQQGLGGLVVTNYFQKPHKHKTTLVIQEVEITLS